VVLLGTMAGVLDCYGQIALKAVRFFQCDISPGMLTMFRVMTFEDWTDVMYEKMEVYPMRWIRGG